MVARRKSSNPPHCGASMWNGWIASTQATYSITSDIIRSTRTSRTFVTARMTTNNKDKVDVMDKGSRTVGVLHGLGARGFG
eukprot:1180351-Prorocentrum_minimum.AAC.1